MKKLCFIIFAFYLSLFISCKMNSNGDNSYNSPFFDQKDLIYPDELVIPDKYNTGVNPDIKLSKITESADVGGVHILIREDTHQYMIAPKKGNLTVDKNGKVTYEMADRCVIENYDFSDMGFVCQNCSDFTKYKTIVFKNCKFNKFRNPPEMGNKLWVEFDHCTFCGNVSEAQISLNYCYIGGFTSDAMNPTRDYKCKNTYVADLVTEKTSGEVHIDGFQTYGRKDIAGGNIYFDNVRFEIPSIHIEGQHSGTAVNACFMFQLEFGNVDTCLYKNLWINGGGKWYPIYLKKSDKFSSKNITLKNAFVSNNFGTIFYPTDYNDEATVENVDHHDLLYVSSVWKDSDGKTHVICTNDTMHKSTLLVKTDKKEYRFEMPRCPSNWNLGGEINKKKDVNDGKGEDESFLTDESGRSYKDYRFSDLPFDVDCVIPDNVSFVKCFDEEQNVQIRYVRFKK